MPLDYQLKNRDVVEVILASKNDQSGPKRGWLEFVKTARAKQRIRAWFKNLNREVNLEAGEKLFQEELALSTIEASSIDEKVKRKVLDNSTWKSWDDIMASIGDGSITARQIIRKINVQNNYSNVLKIAPKNEQETATQEILSWDGIVIRYAECCKPKKGDEVKGFITQGQGITIHRSDCNSLLTSPADRIIDIDLTHSHKTDIKVEIVGDNRVGFVRDITDLIASEKIIIDDMKANNPTPETSKVNVAFSIDNIDAATDLFKKIYKMDGIRSVKRK